jgi:hypothetical protein
MLRFANGSTPHEGSPRPFTAARGQASREELIRRNRGPGRLKSESTLPSRSPTGGLLAALAKWAEAESPLEETNDSTPKAARRDPSTGVYSPHPLRGGGEGRTCH